MAEKDRRVAVSMEELILSNVVPGEALIRPLARKGLLTQQEVLDEVRAVQGEMLPGKKRCAGSKTTP